MTELLTQAIARFLLRLSGQDDGQVYRFKAEEYADRDAGEEKAARGDFATNEEIAAVLAHRHA